MVYHQVQPHSGALAVIASFFIPGLGLMLNAQRPLPGGRVAVVEQEPQRLLRVADRVHAEPGRIEHGLTVAWVSAAMLCPPARSGT
jgi:hypothetical protein